MSVQLEGLVELLENSLLLLVSVLLLGYYQHSHNILLFPNIILRLQLIQCQRSINQMI